MKTHRPQDALEFGPAEFASIFETAIRSGETPDPGEPGKLEVELVGDDGSPVQLSDTPFNRADIALKKRYPEDERQFLSALYRFRALMELITGDALGPWLRTSIRRAGSSRIHPAVLDVASRMRLSKNGKFPTNKFLETVEETAKTYYTDLSEWPLDNPDLESDPRST